MTKAILIIDLPMMCSECPMFTWASRDYEGFCTHSHKLVKFDMRPLDCPLKPMPNRITERGKWISEEYQKGWNACVEVLEK